MGLYLAELVDLTWLQNGWGGTTCFRLNGAVSNDKN